MKVNAENLTEGGLVSGDSDEEKRNLGLKHINQVFVCSRKKLDGQHPDVLKECQYSNSSNLRIHLKH